ncbi:MAG: FAD-dependent oxidoreductase [Desulfobacterales bacterium]|nr:MAG: FAD-dependent oxidoreductase [Desulfobacterales bacterium]
MRDQNRTHGLWASTAQPAPKVTPVDGDRQAEVAIIGGGYTGLTAAIHLAEAGKDVILLEAEHIGYGGAGRNVGFVNPGLWLMPEDVIKRMGEHYGEMLLDVLGASPDLVYALIEKYNIQCEAVRNGTLHCAHSPAGFKELQQREAQWQKRGAPVKLLNREEAAPRIGSQAFYGALFDERAGTIQPLSYARGLARAAQTEGASIHAPSPVTGIKREAGMWHLDTPTGRITASTVIQATLGYASSAFKEQSNQLIPFYYFQFATEPLPEDILKTVLPGKEGALDTNAILSSFRLDDAGRLMVGSVGQVEHMGYAVHESWAQRSIQKVFPQAASVPMEFAWNGRIAMTPNHIPRFHMPDEGMISVGSYNGRGIGPGTVFGKLLAQLVLGASLDTIPLPVTTPKGILARNLRGLFYETGARLYHLIQRRV